MVNQAGLPRELRLALAMKGGVSLAVWMGGACREIARLREENASDEQRDRQPRYQALLRLCGYDTVLVDVLSGSSAGGLNGVLLSQHIASGARFDDGVRDVWLRVADLHQLARRPWSDPPLSLLHGDAAFYRQLVRAMRRLRTGDPSWMAEHPLRLLVTATRLHGRTDALFPTIGDPLVARSNEGFCRFRYPGIADALYVSRSTDHDHAINDFIESDFADRRLAYSARTTSSFPGAFEPALPWVRTDDPTQEVDLYGISSETGTEDPMLTGRAELVDGGLLDNIPIAWAIRSIAGMPASAPVDRWLVYLEPVPTKESKTVADRATSRSVLGMIKLVTTSLMVKTNTESVLDDAQVLSEAAGLTSAQQASIVAALSLAGSEGLRDAAGDQVDPTYVRLFGQLEISRLRQLLLDPFSLVGPDPLPVPPHTFAQDQLEALDAAGPQQAPLLRRVTDEEAALLAGALESTDVQGALGEKAQTPLMAARAVTLLLEAVRAAEGRGEDVPAGLRDRLYAVRLATEMVVAARDRLLLRLADDHLLQNGDPDAPVAPVALLWQANRELAKLLVTLDDLPDSGDNQTLARFWRKWAYDLAAAAVTETSTAIPKVATLLSPPEGPPARPYAMLWAGVLGCDQAYGLIDAPDRMAPTQHSERAMMAETLCSLEVLVGGLRPDPLSSPSVPQFAVLSAGNRSPIEHRLLRGTVRDGNRVNLKLSGNQVANFAGFLSARWRDNDWIWGRLDGAQTLATLIATPERVAAALREDADSTDPRRALREFFVDGAQDRAWTAFFQDRWRELETELATGDRPVAAWFAEVATERLQWDILATEMGRFHQLNDRRIARDDPPDDDHEPEPMPPPNQGTDRLHELGAVGEESVLELVRRAELRRTLVQIALIIWRALVGTNGEPPAPGSKAVIQAAKRESLWRKVRRVGGWAVAPMIVPPVLLSMVSPFSTVFALLFSSIAVSAATGVWASPAHLPVVLGLGVATFVIAANAIIPGSSLVKVRTGVGLHGFRRWLLRLLPLLVIIIGLTGWAIANRLEWRFPIMTEGGQMLWGGLMAGAAFGVTQVDVVWASLRRRRRLGQGLLVRERALSPLWIMVATGVVVLLCGVVTLLPEHWLAGFAIQYVALALSLVGLYVWTDKSATVQQPLEPLDL